ncbi:hypothetical protein EDB89DRAFT_1996001 [Lactarius sanguifluus]|nr:hypothetical protein EDB89DRAFT_1996001 [Lactarius sanguifluus]
MTSSNAHSLNLHITPSTLARERQTHQPAPPSPLTSPTYTATRRVNDEATPRYPDQYARGAGNSLRTIEQPRRRNRVTLPTLERARSPRPFFPHAFDACYAQIHGTLSTLAVVSHMLLDIGVRTNSQKACTSMPFSPAQPPLDPSLPDDLRSYPLPHFCSLPPPHSTLSSPL